MFAPRTAAVVEFSMRPHVDRCYAYIAAALGQDYWLVPQVSAFYHLPYTLDESNVDAVMRVVDHLFRKRNVDDESEQIRQLKGQLDAGDSEIKENVVAPMVSDIVHDDTDKNGHDLEFVNYMTRL